MDVIFGALVAVGLIIKGLFDLIKHILKLLD